MSASYEYYKKKWEKTKPIRGRSVDVRPIDNYRRYRDWETIERRISVKTDGTQQEVYACHLYGTDVVSYYPDGAIGLQIHTYATPTTADFMATHSPFHICKRYNKIWVYPKGHNVDEAYPIPHEGEMRLVMGADGHYKPENPVKIEKVVVDRTKAKEARDKIKPFIDWARSFNKLTDGWIMQETREQFAKYEETTESGWNTIKVDYGLPDGIVKYRWTGRVEGVHAQKVYEYLQTCDDEGWMRVYLVLTDDRDRAEESRLAKKLKVGGDSSRYMEVHDMKFKWETIQNLIYGMVHTAVDTTKKIEVGVGKPMTKVV
jgi:hypothetical protein